MIRKMTDYRLLRLSLFLAVFSGCMARNRSPVQRTELSFLSDQVREEIRKVEKSIIGINTRIRYDVQKFNYELRDGHYVRDPSSPVKYRLHAENGRPGISHEKDTKTLSGGGLIIYEDMNKSLFTLITSSHLVSPPDTTDIYYVDDTGAQTDILYARYVVKDVNISVVSTGIWRAEAKLIANDPVTDLAIISVRTPNRIGLVFPNDVGYDLNLSWGDWVFIFGYPRAVKQMTGGWVSPAPYRGNLAVDAVVRFGFSGGPVFAVSPQDGKLDFVGVIKSVPRRTIDFITHDGTLPPGYRLTPDDLQKLSVKQEILVDYGTAYFVSPDAIKNFFRMSRAALINAQIELDPKYFSQ